MSSESPAPSDPGKPAGVAGGGATKPEIPDYDLIRVIGQGSYGDVWLARGLTGVYRAIKIVWRDRFTSAEPFEREFKGLKKFTTMALPESGQLALLHVGQNEKAGFFYYVMELADDVETGREVDPANYAPLTLREVRTRRGRLPAKECVSFGVELARALAGLHSRGLVHRDIKPSNVILVGGVPKLADIGLVASAGEGLTYVGTEGFVPPEGPGKPAADVYALGRLLYELATGLDREEFPRLPPELNKLADHRELFALNEIILRACEPNSDRRYPDAAGLLADMQALQGQGLVRRRRLGPGGLGLAAAGAILAAGLALYFLRPVVAPTATTEIVARQPSGPGKSIAVLPFENMNDDKEDAFFADGIHEEILTDLGNIAALHVISRRSVMQYRGTTKTISRIAQELGVEFILEGSVRRVGQKVRVTGQLIRAAADEHIWAKAYDGDLSDILGLQTQLATTIAGQLNAILTPNESKRLNAITLADPKAYDLYLQAKELRRHKPDQGGVGANREAESLLRKATELDPKFALAWAELARDHIEQFFDDSSRLDLRDLAKQEIDRSLALAPDRAEPQAALGEYFYYGFYDYENAAACLEKALLLEPSNADLHRLLGLVARRQSRWRKVIAEFARAHELDPHYRLLTEMLRNAYYCVRAYPEGLALVLAQAQAEPDWQENKMAVAFFEASLTLSRRPFDEYLASLTPAQRETEQVRRHQRGIAFLTGDAAQLLHLCESEQARGGPEAVDQDTVTQLAIARRVLGRDASKILPLNQSQMATGVGGKFNAQDWQAQALICALQGDRTGANLALQRSAEMVHSEKDPIEGYVLEVNRARVLEWLGDKAEAVDVLAKLVRRPGVDLGAYELKFSLDWWPLRGDPKFEALIADPATYHPQY